MTYNVLSGTLSLYTTTKYYENPTMLSRVIAKNINDVLRHSVYSVLQLAENK